MIEFTVPGIPVAQPRHRTAVVWSRGRAVPKHYLPGSDPVRGYKDAVCLAARLACREPLDGPVAVAAVFVLPGPPGLHAGVPDLDNLVKSCFDAVRGVLWGDDRQVARLLALKLKGPEPMTRVRVGPLTLACPECGAPVRPGRECCGRVPSPELLPGLSLPPLPPLETGPPSDPDTPPRPPRRRRR